MRLLPWRRKKPRRPIPLAQPKPAPQDPEIARRARIARREANDEAAREPSMLLTTDTYPIYYLPITKCGCTFLKNLFYALDNGDEHPAGLNVHEREDELTTAAGQDYASVNDSPYSFSVLRDPASRFMSFYFDKIWGDGVVNFPKIRAHLHEIGVVDLDRDLDVHGHRANAYRLLDWVERNLRGETDLAVNYHWRPQTGRLRRARMFRLNYLTLEGLDWQLPMLMAPIIPDMAERMQAVKSRNQSARPMPTKDVLDADLATAIRKVYRADTILHERARRAWAGQSPPNRQATLESPPLPRHKRVQRLIAPGQISLTYAPLSGGEHVHTLLGEAGLLGTIADIPFEGLAERGEGALVLLRDPLERFGALYHQILSRPRRSGFTQTRLFLTRRRGLIAQPQSVADHAHNLPILTTYMRRRKPDFIDMQGYARSRLQTHELRRLIAAGAVPIFADQLSQDFARFLARPDLVEPLNAISVANRLPDDIATALTGPVAQAVQNLYRADFDLYDGLRSAAGLPISGEFRPAGHPPVGQ